MGIILLILASVLRPNNSGFYSIIMWNVWVCFKADSSSTHHLSSGNMQQIGLVVAGRQGLRLQSAGILQLLDSGELRLAVAGLSHTEAWQGGDNRTTTPYDGWHTRRLQQSLFYSVITQNFYFINSSTASEKCWQMVYGTGKWINDMLDQ